MPRPDTPALATQLSTWPSTFTVSAKASITCFSSPTSTIWAWTLRPWRLSFSAAASFFSWRVPQMQTSAPASAIASAMPKPMPPLPPVTSATLPLRSKPL